MDKSMEITVQELLALDDESFSLIDVRDELSFSYGHLKNAVNIPMERLKSDLNDLNADGIIPKSEKIVVYCCFAKRALMPTVCRADIWRGSLRIWKVAASRRMKIFAMRLKRASARDLKSVYGANSQER
jgi:hypothetical protein